MKTYSLNYKDSVQQLEALQSYRSHYYMIQQLRVKLSRQLGLLSGCNALFAWQYVYR
jgi:hypothetical protein